MLYEIKCHVEDFFDSIDIHKFMDCYYYFNN